MGTRKAPCAYSPIAHVEGDLGPSPHTPGPPALSPLFGRSMLAREADMEEACLAGGNSAPFPGPLTPCSAVSVVYPHLLPLPLPSHLPFTSHCRQGGNTFPQGGPGAPPPHSPAPFWENPCPLPFPHPLPFPTGPLDGGPWPSPSLYYLPSLPEHTSTPPHCITQDWMHIPL